MINTLSLLNIADLIKAAGSIPLVHVATCYVHGFNTGTAAKKSLFRPAGIQKKSERLL